MGLQVVRDCGPQKIMAAVYSRVSTVGHGQDAAMQTRELREYCQRRGWDIFDCYVDEGVSGKKDSRPELNRLMADAHAGDSTWSSSGGSTAFLDPCRISAVRWTHSTLSRSILFR